MPISYQYQCVFVHIPKNAGTSISQALDLRFNHCQIRKRFGIKSKKTWKKYHLAQIYKNKVLQHLTLPNMIKINYLPFSIFQNFYKFAFVRNPWDRFISEFFYLKKDKNFSEYLKIFNETSIQYILKNQDYDHVRQQVDYIQSYKNIKMDFIGRFENLQEDWNKICDNIKFGNSLKYLLGQIKIDYHTNRKKDYKNYYNSRTKKLIEKTYQQDIDTFHYTF